jgi:formylglycine-generating enzyme required for sulfatase activity
MSGQQRDRPGDDERLEGMLARYQELISQGISPADAHRRVGRDPVFAGVAGEFDAVLISRLADEFLDLFRTRRSSGEARQQVVARCPPHLAEKLDAACDEQLVLDEQVAHLRATDPLTTAEADGNADEAVPTPNIRGYDILRPLGRGGMGVVYLARSKRMGRLVVLKVMTDKAVATDAGRERFVREARAMAAIDHPSVVAIYHAEEYEIDEKSKGVFIEMEYCAGGTLKDKLNNGLLSVGDAASLVELLARAAHYMHEKKIIHRDLKPENVLFSAPEVVKIADFGLASYQGPEGDDPRITASGDIFGTPTHMAPEQADGRVRDIGRHTDVWALGIILYECLTGYLPFRGQYNAETLRRVRKAEPVRPSWHQETVPRDMDEICLKCLEKDLRHRYASAVLLADDLANFRAGRSVLARPRWWPGRVYKWTRRRTRAQVLASLAATSLALLALLAVGIIGRLRAADHVTAVRASRTEDVPRLVAERWALRGLTIPQLSAAADDAALQPRERVNLALALLILGDGGAADAHAEAVCDRLLDQAASPEEVRVFRDALGSYRGRFRDRLWQLVEDPQLAGYRRLRAASALAAFDPGSPRWREAAGTTAEGLVREDALQVRGWVDLLRPVRAALVPALSELFRAGDRPGERRLAADILADYAADDPRLLADLATHADEEQFARLWAPLARHRDAVATGLKEVLAEAWQPSWADGPVPPSWAAPDPELVRRVESARGLVTDRFALCQEMPLDEFVAVADGLRPTGYRPTRVRPYHAGQAVRVAAVWVRDGRPWGMAHAATSAEVRGRDAAERRRGLIPVDVAGYPGTGPGGSPTEYYAALWAVPGDPAEDARLLVGVPEGEFTADGLQALRRDDYLPGTFTAVRRADGSGRCSSVWVKSGRRPNSYTLKLSLEEPYLETMLRARDLQVDAGVWSPKVGVDPPAIYREQLARAEKRLGSRADDLEALFLRAESRFWLGQDDEAVGDLSALLGRPVDLTRSYWLRAVAYRAQAYARQGRAAEAKRDLAGFRTRNPNIGEAAFLDAAVAASLQDDGWMSRLEATVKEYADDPEVLYQAACAYAVAARTGGRGRPDLRKAHAARAAALLGNAVANGFRDLARVKELPVWDAVRDDPAIAAVLAAAKPDRCYSALWWHGGEGVESEEAHGTGPGEHLDRCRGFAARGFRPVAVSVFWPGEGKPPVACSVWHRPEPEAARDALAKRQARAAVALFRLGQPDAVRPFLLHGPDPRVRTYLVHLLGPLGADPAAVARLLAEETERGRRGEPGADPARRALVLALGGFGGDRPPQVEGRPLAETLLGWYRDDPDPGVRSAAEWVLREWGGGERRFTREMERIDAEQRSTDPAPGRRWFVNGQGQMLSVIPAPGDIRLGSPGFEPGRNAAEELHTRRVTRTFAIGTKEVTVGQLLRFRQDVRYGHDRETDPDAPGCRLSWYEAAMYCRWLSEREGVPPDQMCYPPVPEIAHAMERRQPLRLPGDWLSRTGYRLPTEAEWEYACRAGASTPRFYGVFEPAMLDRYAWSARNSDDRPHPAGRRKPNDLGLFDVYGNALEWCHDPMRSYPRGVADRPREDRGGVPVVAADDLRVIRGGSFASGPLLVRSGGRWSAPPAQRLEAGLRLARTCR